MKELKLHLGCGNTRLEGYVNIDLVGTSATDRVMNLISLDYADSSVDEIRAEHVIEHFSREEFKIALRDWFRVLKKGGRILLECPDLEACMQEFLKAPYADKWGWWIKTIYGTQERLGQEHRNGFSEERLEELLELAGFKEVKTRKVFSHDSPSIQAEAKK